MNILPFGFTFGNGAGGSAGITAQMPPSGLGFAVALDGAFTDTMPVPTGPIAAPPQAGPGAPVPGMAAAPVLAPTLSLSADAPLYPETSGMLPPAMPMSQLLATAARVPAPTVPVPATVDGTAVAPAAPTAIPTALPKPQPLAEGAANPLAGDARTQTKALAAGTPVIAPAEAATVAEAGQQPPVAAGPADAAAPSKAQPQKSRKAASGIAEQPLATDAGIATASPSPPTAGPPLQPQAAPIATPAPATTFAPAEPAAASQAQVPAPRKGPAATAAGGAAAARTETSAATVAPADGFAAAIAKLGDTDGQQGSGAGSDNGQQPMLAQDAAKPAQGQQSVAQHFQSMPGADAVRPAAATVNATAATAPAPEPAADPVVTARPGQLGQSMGVEIARKIESGEETLRVRLNPVELGRVEVTLAFDDSGSLQATMRTESAQALELLRQDAPELARTLDQAGVRTDAQSFRFESRAGDGGNQSSPQHQRGQQHDASAEQGDFETDDQPYRAIRGDGRVDLLA